eukprot:GHVQ01026846.1.p1 GENE.GHVQ01026846.1~~GHVQ01026846.1.p1  ORF type:complete len:908 (+),score=93.05 GHVQ01026846.1:459-3182(+)
MADSHASVQSRIKKWQKSARGQPDLCQLSTIGSDSENYVIKSQKPVCPPDQSTRGKVVQYCAMFESGAKHPSIHAVPQSDDDNLPIISSSNVKQSSLLQTLHQKSSSDVPESSSHSSVLAIPGKEFFPTPDNHDIAVDGRTQLHSQIGQVGGTTDLYELCCSRSLQDKFEANQIAEGNRCLLEDSGISGHNVALQVETSMVSESQCHCAPQAITRLYLCGTGSADTYSGSKQTDRGIPLPVSDNVVSCGMGTDLCNTAGSTALLCGSSLSGSRSDASTYQRSEVFPTTTLSLSAAASSDVCVASCSLASEFPASCSLGQPSTSSPSPGFLLSSSDPSAVMFSGPLSASAPAYCNNMPISSGERSFCSGDSVDHEFSLFLRLSTHLCVRIFMNHLDRLCSTLSPTLAKQTTESSGIPADAPITSTNNSCYISRDGGDPLPYSKNDFSLQSGEYCRLSNAPQCGAVLGQGSDCALLSSSEMTSVGCDGAADWKATPGETCCTVHIPPAQHDVTGHVITANRRPCECLALRGHRPCLVSITQTTTTTTTTTQSTTVATPHTFGIEDCVNALNRVRGSGQTTTSSAWPSPRHFGRRGTVPLQLQRENPLGETRLIPGGMDRENKQTSVKGQSTSTSDSSYLCLLEIFTKALSQERLPLVHSAVGQYLESLLTREVIFSNQGDYPYPPSPGLPTSSLLESGGSKAGLQGAQGLDVVSQPDEGMDSGTADLMCRPWPLLSLLLKLVGREVLFDYSVPERESPVATRASTGSSVSSHLPRCFCPIYNSPGAARSQLWNCSRPQQEQVKAPDSAKEPQEFLPSTVKASVTYPPTAAMIRRGLEDVLQQLIVLGVSGGGGEYREDGTTPANMSCGKRSKGGRSDHSVHASGICLLVSLLRLFHLIWCSVCCFSGYV